MSIAVIQLLKSDFNPLVLVALDNTTDHGVAKAWYVGATSTLPTDAYFMKGAELTHVVDGTLFINTAADNTTPTWVQVGAASGITALTGDVTASGTGSVAATIAAGAVTKAKLDVGVRPSHMVIAARKAETTVGGSTTETFSVPGATGLDIAFVQMVDRGTNDVSIETATITGADTLTVTFDADPGNDCQFAYQVIRATV